MDASTGGKGECIKQLTSHLIRARSAHQNMSSILFIILIQCECQCSVTKIERKGVTFELHVMVFLTTWID